MFKPHKIGKYGDIQHFLYSLIENFALWPKFFWKLHPKIIRQLIQEGCSLPQQIRQPCWLFSPSEGVLIHYIDIWQTSNV